MPGHRGYAHATRTGADLIVIGSRGRTGLTRTVLGSVTREVLTTANPANRHGATTNLTPAQLDDLVAYVLSL